MSAVIFSLLLQEPGAPDPVGSKYQDPGMGGYDAPPLQASPRGPPSGGRPPRGTRGKSPGGRGGRFGGSAVRGGRGSAPPPAGGNRTPSNVRDYHHQPPVGYDQSFLCLLNFYLCIAVVPQLVWAMENLPRQVMAGTLLPALIMVMSHTTREIATMAALQTTEEGMLAMIEEEVQLFN